MIHIAAGIYRERIILERPLTLEAWPEAGRCSATPCLPACIWVQRHAAPCICAWTVGTSGVLPSSAERGGDSRLGDAEAL